MSESFMENKICVYRPKYPNRNKLKENMLFCLVYHRKKDLIEKLLHFKLNLQCEFEGATLLDYACSGLSTDKELIKLLRKYGLQRKIDTSDGKRYVDLFAFSNVEGFIKECCKVYFKTNSQVKVGDDVRDTESKKAQLCEKNFGIPQREKMYLITDSTLFHNYKTGMAFCTTGLYLLTDDSQKIYIPWTEFGKINIICEDAYIILKEHKVFCAFSEKMEKFLLHLRRELSNIEEFLFQREKIQK